MPSKFAGHTPGPWKVTHEERIVGPDFPGAGIVATVNLSRSPRLGAPSDGEANARLIAAAPDLLRQRDELAEALRNMTPALRFAQQKPEQAADICEQLREHIRVTLSRLDSED